MTEKEKGLKGELYNPNTDPQLQREMVACKALCHRYNSLPPDAEAEGAVLLGEILGRCGTDVKILAPFWCDYGANITVGDHFFANHNLVILDGADVSFGDHVFIGPNCCFTTATHPVEVSLRDEGLELAKPIRVGGSVWFGAGVTVLPGVTIGNRVVVGAGSVVTRDLPDDVVAAGNPCRVLRHLTEVEKD